MPSAPNIDQPKPECPQFGLLAAILLFLLPLNRASGQEDNMIGYRYELYHEDNSRMTIRTESVALDAALSSKLRVNWNFVLDAISGATPVGAPPQNKWPFPSFQTLYNSDYKTAYTSQFNQFVAQNQIYVDNGYETAQQLTNAATKFATTAAPTIASNTAATTLKAITGSPFYHNNSVPLTRLHDRRVAMGFGTPIAWKNEVISPSFAHSQESDYISWSGAMNYSHYFNQKNTTLSLGASHDSDSVRDDKFIWEPKMTDAVFAGLTQLITPKSYLTVNATASFERGYLSDPYRGVMAAENFLQLNPADPALIAERRPRHRNSEVVYASWTQFVSPADASVEGSYRIFHDSYGVISHTMEVDWHQKLAKRLVLTPSFRCNYQDAANFYYVLVPDYAHLPPYYSSDYRLSQFVSFAVGLSLTWRVQEHLSFDLSYMRYVMYGLDGITSQSAYPSANVFSAGLRVWF
jgi:hypothetical protein